MQRSYPPRLLRPLASCPPSPCGGAPLANHSLSSDWSHLVDRPKWIAAGTRPLAWRLHQCRSEIPQSSAACLAVKASRANSLFCCVVLMMED